MVQDRCTPWWGPPLIARGWRWPAFAWAYMTAIGYIGALLAYQLL